MSMREPALLLAALSIIAGCSRGDDAAGATPHLGRPAPAEVVRRLDISVLSDGTGLPPGAGTVANGRVTFAAKCVACHGEAGTGGPAGRLTGGIGTLASPKPIRSVTSYWPYAPTLFDYIRRAMPLTAPQSLTNDEVYGLTAYLLSLDGIVPADTRMDAAALSRVTMPNRNGFVSLEARDFDGNIDRVTRQEEK
ncbi:c-type cytochrome [Sphingomonas sp. DT-51]|uniref:c-type cytochrome n=1 Tax=Sphingomonas sp. DT-51 TaxID=3396165 RepID=UPI003F1AC523